MQSCCSIEDNRLMAEIRDVNSAFTDDRSAVDGITSDRKHNKMLCIVIV